MNLFVNECRFGQMNAQGEKQGKKIKNNDSDRQLVSEIAEFLLYNVSALSPDLKKIYSTSRRYFNHVARELLKEEPT